MAAGSSSSSCSLLLLLLLLVAVLSLPYASNAGCSRHLTAGFSRVKLSESQFVVQKPYDVPLHERYEQSGGVRRMWVSATYKPISGTRPGYARTEIRVAVCHLSTAKRASFFSTIPGLFPILTLHAFCFCRRCTAPWCGSSRATCTCRRARQ